MVLEVLLVLPLQKAISGRGSSGGEREQGF
jgi:hypothetical protein